MESLPIRASCDACGVAKVLCSKNRPSCARCSSIGIACVYSPSRKYGKASRRHQHRPTHASSRPAVSRSYPTPPAHQDVPPPSPGTLSDEPEISIASTLSASAMSSEATSLDFTMLHPASWQAASTAERENSLQADWLPVGSSAYSRNDDTDLQNSPVGDAIGVDLDVNIFEESHGETTSPTSMSRYLEDRQVSGLMHQAPWLMVAGCPASRDGPSEVHRHSCSIIAHRLCIDLEHSSSSRLCDRDCAAARLDRVLARNRTAVRCIEDMLVCNQCLASTSTALSIGSLLGKILLWYTEAALTVNRRGLHPTGSSSMSLASPSITHVPLRVGSLAIDGEQEQQMLVHFIVSELKVAERVVEALVAWLLDAPNQPIPGHSIMQRVRQLTHTEAKLAASTLGQTLRAECQRAFLAARC